MSLPPSSPDIDGWHLTGFKIGYRARVTAQAATMRVECAPDETGPDSGFVAIDATVTKVSYSLYLSCAECRDFKIPGGPRHGIASCNLRMPGWNTVVATRDACLINGIECGPGDPTDLGCYATVSGCARHVYMNDFQVEREPASETVDTPVTETADTTPQFRFV
jgi:hypothetical protein